MSDEIFNSTHYFARKIPNQQEFQKIAYDHSLDIDFEEFINLYKKCTTEPYFFTH